MTAKTIARRVLMAPLGATPFAASADENGVMQQQSYPSTENARTSNVAVREPVKQVLAFIQCPTTTGTSVWATRRSSRV